jgi:PAS domain S-box-containing protein
MTVRHELAASALTDLLFEEPGFGRCLVAPDGRVLRANAEWLRSTGFTLDNVLGADIVDLFPETREMALAMHARVRAGHRVEVPRHAQRIQGRETWWEGSIAPVPVENGTGLLITSREVTDRVHAPDTEAVRRDSALMRAVADCIPDPVFVKDVESRILFANPATLKVIGKTAEQVIGKTDQEIYEDPEVGATVVETDRRIMESGQAVAVEERIQTPAGYHFFLSTKAPFRDAEEGKVIGLVGVARDITERKQAEEALRESETRYRLLFQNMLDGFAYCRMIFDDRGRPDDFVYLEVNGAFEKLTGLRDVVGKKVSEVIPGIRGAHPELLEIYGRVAKTGRPERFEIEVLPLAAWLSISVYRPHPDHFVAVFDNITDRKRAEEALRVADRRKDEFLGMLSHELRNPLAPIRNSIYILRHANPGGEQAHRAQNVIERQTHHLTRLVDDLLDVTRIARGKIEVRRERVDLRDLVRRTGEDFRALMEDRGIRFEVDVPETKAWADADSTRVAQVIGNMLHNAAKYSRRDDHVRLTLHVDTADAEISVCDTGVGIDAALLPYVFEPFVQGERSLARTDGGLGLGLALVKGISELHGGTVRAESAGAGKGATVVVRLPLLAPMVVHEKPAPAVRRANGSRRVLVVDDNRDAAESLGEIAMMLGHTVEVVNDGPSALDAARRNPPDVVLCDIGMPGMSGYDVARELRKTLSSSARLIAVSGYAQAEDLRAAVEAGFDRHIAKPASAEDIERLLE